MERHDGTPSDRDDPTGCGDGQEELCAGDRDRGAPNVKVTLHALVRLLAKSAVTEVRSEAGGRSNAVEIDDDAEDQSDKHEGS